LHDVKGLLFETRSLNCISGARLLDPTSWKTSSWRKKASFFC